MSRQAYFDFHIHPVTKNFLTKFEEVYPTQRSKEEITSPVDLKNFLSNFLDDEFLHIMESQASYEQINKGNLECGVFTISPVELIFTQKKGIFGILLNSKFFIEPLDTSFFECIASGKISYYQLVLKELNLYGLVKENFKVKFLQRKNQESFDNDGTKYVALALEGAHGLCRTKIGSYGTKDELIGYSHNNSCHLADDFYENPVLSASESLQHFQTALWKEGYDLCYLTLTHLSYIKEHFIATHAYGIKMLSSSARYPTGHGIQEMGRQLIDTAYSLKVDGNDASVLLDIKHMSLKSRLDFYRYRKEKNYRLPIIGSHMGVTGYSIEEWKNSLKKAEITEEGAVEITMDRSVVAEGQLLHDRFTFNPWSINLMNEDITEIFNSGGYIGVSLDVRILGWQPGIALDKEAEEYLSYEDYRYFFPGKKNGFNRRKSIFDFLEDQVLLASGKDETHPLALCFNILHIVSVGMQTTGTDPWKHITIGSDFDGLIEPVINCRGADCFVELESQLFQWLPEAEKMYRKKKGGPPLILRNQNEQVVESDLQNKIRDFCLHNGNRFLQDWALGKFSIYNP